jgi:hypothetical protein
MIFLNMEFNISFNNSYNLLKNNIHIIRMFMDGFRI